MELGLLLSQGWASGINLYAVVALLGLTGRAGWYDAPALLEQPAVIGAAVLLYLVEFVADKVPYLDNTWDAVHTFVRPFGAAVVGAALAGQDVDATFMTELVAGGGSGLLALASHATKATTRLAINTSPEPVSNILASVAEDSLVVAVLLLAINNPVLAAVVVLVLLVVGAAIAAGLWKAAKAVRARVRERRAGTERVSRISGRPLP